MDGDTRAFPRLHDGQPDAPHHPHPHHSTLRLPNPAAVARQCTRNLERRATRWSRHKGATAYHQNASAGSHDLFAAINSGDVHGGAEPMPGADCFDHLTSMMVDDAVARLSATDVRPLEPPVWIRLVGVDAVG